MDSQKLDNKKYPEPVAGGIIYNEKGEVFLTKSSKWGDFWQVPGGHIEIGETAEQALKREIKEETGLDIDNIEFNDYQDCVYPELFEKKVHFVFLTFSARMSGGKLIEKNREMEDFIWIKPEEVLETLKVNPYTRKSLEIFVENKRESLENKYKRALADYQNLLKQTVKEKEEYAKYANETLIEQILPIYDHLKMALDHANGTPGDAKNVVEGVKHIVKQFKDTLERFGVNEIKTIGQKFDHNLMEAISDEPTDDHDSDHTVAKQIKGGYTLNGKVIAPARVVVYKVKD